MVEPIKSRARTNAVTINNSYDGQVTTTLRRADFEAFVARAKHYKIGRSQLMRELVLAFLAKTSTE